MSLETALAEPVSKQQQMIETAMSRQAAEVQAAMVIAKKFPRDHTRSLSNILTACKRRVLAEQAGYEYPRGDEQVTGPSIRLAEALAQNWGNVDFGITELAQGNGESTVQAYCWDLETNTRQTKIFTVPHMRFTKKGSYKLNDPRDIYELVANQGARRLRACILGIIPGDVVDAAMEECEKTLQSKAAAPLGERIGEMVASFATLGVTVPMIEAKLGHGIDATSDRELSKFGRQFNAIKDGWAKVEDLFDMAGTTAPGQSISSISQSQGETAKAAPTAPRDTQRAGSDAGVLDLEVEPAGVHPDPVYGAIVARLNAADISAQTLLAWAQRQGSAPKGAKALYDIGVEDAKAILKGFDSLIPILSKKTK